MPSSFPGMDPYLEHPAFFPGIHDGLIFCLREALQPKLPEPYYAEFNDRLWVEVSQRPIEPDVNILRRNEETGRETGGGVAVDALTGVQPVIVTVPHDEHREPYLEIFARIEGQERIVTTIEVLSLSNKTRGSKGRKLYRRKQREVLAGETNLVEIDLLRGGEHTTAVPLAWAVRKAGAFDSHICIHRPDEFEDYVVYPIRLRDRLPEFAIPLLPGDGTVSVDLQALLDRSYDTGPYQRRLRYAEVTPEPPLRPEDAEWAAGLLRLAAQ